ncbi:MAG: LD-carboxypeptidase [Lachnospiraceae bacterium]|nr:LD-carboxypeptidase [Lachnospiraceae bacterium]
MLYPKWLKKGDLIGIPAPSAGIREEKLAKFDLSIENVKKEGYRVRETASVRSGLIASASGEVRGREFMELIEDDEVKMIWCAAGGEFLIDMLPYLDEEKIKANPKWIQGYSDPTSILFSVTTGLDIATIYGCNGGGFGMAELHPSLKENLELWKGQLSEQTSYDLFEGEWSEPKNLEPEEPEFGNPKGEKPETEKPEDESDGYYLTNPVEWKTPNGPVSVSGRLIGGCMDCLLDLIGTPQDHTKEFVSRYKEDGFIWYFDVYSMTAESVYRTLLHMKRAGWLENVKGVIFGRVTFPQTFADMTYEEAALKALGRDIPLIMEADVGHVSPRMTFVNGCMAHVEAADGKGRIRYEWRE